MKTKVIKCECTSEYQDRIYGERKRLHNFTPKKPKPGERGSKCTVCGATKNADQTGE